MAKVLCEIEEVELAGDHSDEVPGLCATCARCGHAVEVYGRSDRSERRALVMLREECPEGEANFYVNAESDPE